MTGQISLADGSDFLKSLHDGRAKALIHCPGGISYEILKKKLTHESKDGAVECPEIPSLQLLIPCVLDSEKDSGKSLMDELKEIPEGICEDNGPSSVCVYLCTSGSTGPFKVVPLTSQTVLKNGQEIGKAAGIGKGSVFFNDKPMGWLGGAPFVTFATGCTRITVDNSVPRGEEYPKFVSQVFRREKCTEMLTTVQWLANLMEEEMKNQNGNQYLLRSVIVGGAPSTKDSLKAIGVVTERVVNLYGSTEAGFLATVTVTSREDEFTDYLCGWPIDGVQFKVVNQKMEEIPVGQIGEILVKTPLQSLGYANNGNATKETFLPDGWLKLGDMGCLNDKGQITVVGRNAHCILRGVNVIYPALVEAPLLQCPGVAAALVTSVPDEKMMEEVCALLVRQQGAGEEIDEKYVERYCREKLFVSADKMDFDFIPGYFRFVDAIPKLSNGKEDRTAAKLLAAQLVGK